MELFFLGTSAGLPTRTRNVSGILLNLQHPNHADLWLFDCGEGTQHQLLRTTFHPGKLNKIFITHLHGDHIFGLPGLLCSRSMIGNTGPIIIYGPIGVDDFIKTALRLSNSSTDFQVEVVEIKTGLIFRDENYTVTAWPMNHSIECYGYRIEEHDKPGTLDATMLQSLGVNPGPIFRYLKRGETIVLNDGRIIHGKDYLSPPLPGRKLAIFGDTAPCINSQDLARKVDLMVCEATLENAMEEKANSRGHISTRQAAQIAKSAGARRLIVTHISSRYNEKGCTRLLQECRKVFPASEIAKDFSSFRI